MQMSETISAIATALSKAQAMIDDATKDSSNPHFKSKYADLASVRATIREPLAVNDLAVVQGPRKADGGVEVETMIIHKSGEWISESVFIPVNKWDAHGMGSGITYGRRYGLMALLCIATDDDDGNAAVERGPTPPKKPGRYSEPMPASTGQEILIGRARAAAFGGVEIFRAFYKELSPSDRNLIVGDLLDELKALATSADAAKNGDA